MKYKIAVGVFSAAMIVGAVASTSFADGYGYRNNNGFESKRGIPGGDPDQSWNQYLNNGSNNDFARRYRENPNIIYDKDVMAHEPGVRAWLDQHPGAREDIYGRAGAAREKHWERKHERRSDNW
jgi:hypothetical protein